jgi:hypothetical protein
MLKQKWIPVRVKKTRQNKKVEPRSDSIGTEKALGSGLAGDLLRIRRGHLPHRIALAQ